MNGRSWAARHEAQGECRHSYGPDDSALIAFVGQMAFYYDGERMVIVALRKLHLNDRYERRR